MVVKMRLPENRTFRFNAINIFKDCLMLSWTHNCFIRIMHGMDGMTREQREYIQKMPCLNMTEINCWYNS